ncbi:MAG: SDR family oxidoreductase [Anaerolineae bacterium]|nr:SDR family oxidoreductase [Anaerolineae bacterium]MCA9892225.1 SDR family oxidoreductase [Anaerolineae bacterium]MCB9460873.1 SDR family oxidoreductase [Anaerolineaceae bacterium]
MNQPNLADKWTVFVTGSTGLLGSNLVRLLVAEGHHVKAMARNVEKARRLLGDLDVEIVQGDMEDVDAIEPLLQGVDVLMHTAAYFREYYQPGENHWENLSRINIRGTVNLLTAAERQGVQKAIYVSSSTTIGAKVDGSPSDENTGATSGKMSLNAYARSKVVAEEGVAHWLRAHHMPVVLINPSWIWGPGDAAPTATGKIVLDFLRGDLPAIPSGGSSLVDARDVAQAMIAAVTHGRSGERYIINNAYYSLSDILAVLSDITGINKPRIYMPYALGMAYATVAEIVARITGNPPLATRSGLRTINIKIEYTSAKAAHELGHKPRSLEQTLRDEVQWFIDNGYVQQEFKLSPVMS